MSSSSLRSENFLERFKEFRSICIEIRRDFNTYNHLFTDDNSDVLMKVAGHFFNDIARIMQRDWLLQVVKICDPMESNVGGYVHENITIDRILVDLEPFSHRDLKEYELARLAADKAMRIKSYIHGLRNRLLAHNDLKTCLSGGIIGEFPESVLVGFLDGIQEFCDSAGRIMGLGPLSFISSSGPGDVLDLLRKLKA